MYHNCISTLTHAVTNGYYQLGKYSWKRLPTVLTGIILVYVSAYWILLAQASVC